MTVKNNLQKPVIRWTISEGERVAPVEGADDGGGEVKAHRRVKGLREPFHRQNVVCCPRFGTCVAFQRQFAHRALEVPDRLVNQETQTSIFDHR